MAQVVGKMRISPAANPGFWACQTTFYDTVLQTWRTETLVVSDADMRDKGSLQGALGIAYGPIDWAASAPPSP
jgi:hypothetical protein